MKNKLQIMIQWVKAHQLILKLIFFGSILVFVANQVANIAHGMSWQDVWHTMEQQSHVTLAWMILAGLIGVMPMLLYDWVTIRVLEKQGKPKMSRKDFLLSAWITNTINNLAGFGGIVGASLRASFYGKHTNRKMVLATVSKVALFLLTGLSIWSLVTFINVFFLQTDSVFRSYWIWLFGGSFLAPLIFLFAYLKRKTLFVEFYPKGLLGLLLASFGQWTGALVVFLLIGRLMAVDISVWSLYPMFIIATLIGMLTMVPGGVGTFDVLMILGMSQLGVRQDVALVWLLYYRLFYYVLPFLSGIVLFLTHTGVKINRFLDNIPRLFFQKIAHLVLVCAVYFAGIMMVLLSTITNLSTVSRLFQILLPFSFDFLDQSLNLLVGFLLLGLARALAMKVKKAFIPTIALLAFGIINTVMRTLSWELIVVYLLILLAVWLSRKEFYREKFVYSWGAIIFDACLFGFLFIVYAIAGYHRGSFWVGDLTANRFILFPSEDVWFSGLIGLGISLLALVALYQYLASETGFGEPLDQMRLNRLLTAYGGTAASHYLHLPGYTYFYYQENGQDKVVFGYQIKGNKCFVLGDPIGDPTKIRTATHEFLKKADCFGYELAFYKVSESYVVMLHEAGFHFAKVGEAAITDLSSDALHWRTKQIELQRLTNEGYHFTWYDQLPEELLEPIQEVSQKWLDGSREKHFSVGYFEKDYLLMSGIGIVRKEQKIVGFITSQPINDRQAGYDLLRYLPNQPNSLGDYLLANLLDVYRKNGYAEANLGLAPLANVGETDFSFLQEKVMRIIFNYGNFFYSFQLAYEEKQRYVTHWEGRYFAYMKGSSFTLATWQLFLLIGKGKEKGTSLAEEVLTEL
ncbi:MULTISPECIES: bifunctional lysylphosphatidylglycerol flippase/synthetase MprF [Enterococcus]|uniref:Phosphatidylglycerol lysyltransferase n=1 Tax=Enterococcus mundtii TaxID=53346 RepID=A0A1V2UGA3_ENTMU|nr:MULTISPECIES: bifunctional lysylphosphatidylglycerol flippase/synthetase MprF [Enterococcus]EOH65955.1 phosphatidylglycerol lysyltransferase [Enterococcus mundtii ATCC 882]EOU13925.1 phosphatidylglycerol lysyltransferase [Enterococcus mundtii ATCC 882]MBE9911969.1 bifunctional lysylphosphatidylglycerol flippase/synthetase MprF [Enterococcus mundtii]MCA6775004.1 bifunctional lysylphosphatidylglycerol flippase/synthetase MprF [Enterococcus mundtii]NMP57526.1 bifunctional lysylphosphatidylglyc